MLDSIAEALQGHMENKSRRGKEQKSKEKYFSLVVILDIFCQ